MRYSIVQTRKDVRIRLYVNYEDVPVKFSVGTNWAFTTIATLPELAVYVENNWTAEVVAEEEVIVPISIYDCYKVEITRDGGCVNTEWWAVDGDFCTPVKYTNNCDYIGAEVAELVPYTLP